MMIVHIVDPFAAGLATFLKLLTEELSSDYHIIVHGERKELADPKDIKKFFPKKNIRFIYWKSVQRDINPVKDVMAYLELVAILKRFRKADVIHLHSSKAGFLGRIACRQLGIKHVIYTPNGAPFLMSNASDVKLKIYEKLEKFANLFGGKIICTSLSEQEEYLKRGIDADFINNGTNISKQSFKSDKDYNKFRIVTSGRVVDQKNPKLFNDVALALADLKHFEFIWIGDGQDADILTSPNIIKTGWLSKEGVRNKIATADLYFSTSVFEGLPFAVIEAMALGKCLLLSNCTGNVDLVESGRNGEIYNTKEEAINHILYFYFNKEITESMGMESIEICKDYFNIEDTANRYLRLYQRVRRLPAYSSVFKWALRYSR
ncbi:MAG: glycosyltransferase family 4 protein [Bacteroidetes bacterium]|nr:glycosyltransferase family 4 protein [Bacteroidota bacterium]